MATSARASSSGPRPGSADPDGPVDVVARLDHDVAALDAELTEIEMLIQQAQAEAERHAAKRTAAADKLEAWKGAGRADPAELEELNAQLLNLTRRSLVMESQVEVLNGKQRALRRYRDATAELADQLRGLAGGKPILVAGALGPSRGDAALDAGGATAELEPGGPLPPAISRMVLAAQEDLRRDIARAMHDGPAQSLTNIVLQAQIVDALIAKDPAQAKPEVRQLIAMVQQTLDATKTFIFDVRPMVLDDLGLVPTLRRAARDRGRRVQIPVDFESLGPDRRLSMELESGLFRMLEEALAAYLGAGPDRVAIRLDWSADQLEAVVRSVREAPVGGEPATSGKNAGRRILGRGREKATNEAELPPALAAMIEDRKGEQAAAAAASAAPVPLPAKSWREIQDRAATLGASAALSDDGSELTLVVELSAA